MPEIKEALEQMLLKVTGAVKTIGSSIESEAVKAAPVVTGNLRNSISVGTPVKNGDNIELPISMTEYGIFVNEGTGIYSKTRNAPYPVKHKLRDGSFRTSMHPGMKGRQFIQSAITTVVDSGEVETTIKKALS